MAKASTTVKSGAGVRVAVITLDRHLEASIARAEAGLSRLIPGLSISLHAAAEWNGRPEALADAEQAIAEADIIVACMIFIDDQVQAILPALKARREHCTALLGCVSSPEIVQLTRLGQLDMSAKQTGPMALLKRLRGKVKPGGGTTTSGASQMAMLRRQPVLHHQEVHPQILCRAGDEPE
ncbi:MAG: DUF3479 domain-containing protein, partial [Chromatocurvus sp.]